MPTLDALGPHLGLGLHPGSPARGGQSLDKKKKKKKRGEFDNPSPTPYHMKQSLVGQRGV